MDAQRGLRGPGQLGRRARAVVHGHRGFSRGHRRPGRGAVRRRPRVPDGVAGQRAADTRAERRDRDLRVAGRRLYGRQ